MEKTTEEVRSTELMHQTAGAQPGVPQSFPMGKPTAPQQEKGQDSYQFLCEWPTTRPDGADQSILCKSVGHLEDKGVPRELIHPAVLIMMCLMSPRLGYPISLMLKTGNQHQAVKLIENALTLVPESSVVQFLTMKPEDLFADNGRHIAGKCLLSPNYGGFEKVLPYIESIMSRGYAICGEIVRGKYAMRHEEYRIEFPISLIGLDDGKLIRSGLHHQIIVVPIKEATAQPSSSRRIIEPDELLNAPAFKIRKTLERLRHRKVVIPYLDQLRSIIWARFREHQDSVLLILSNMISLWAIINSPPAVTMEELAASFYATSEKEVRDYLLQVSGAQKQSPQLDEPLVATERDYHLAKVLLDGLFHNGERHCLSERQRLVFEAVKEINTSKKGTVFFEKGDEPEQITTIAKSQSNWARREKVYEIASRKSNGAYSSSTIRNDLEALCKMGLLEKSRPPKSHYYEYYVSTMNPDSSVVFPAAAEIRATEPESLALKVVNPITGLVEEI